MTTETTALTVQARAAVALGSSKAEAELTALASESKAIVAITNQAGREECHAAAMKAKQARVSIERTAKIAREDATAFSKAVIAEGVRLAFLIEPEESRLLSLRDEWDEKIAAEKAAKVEAERLAIAAIVKRLDAIKSWPLLAADVTSESVLDEIEQLEAMEIGDSFKDYYGEAVEAKAASLQKLREIYAAKVRAEAEAQRIKQEREAEDARLKAEREELDRKRAEQNRIDAQRRAEREEEDRKAKVQRDEQERQLQAQRDELARQQKVIDDQRAEHLRVLMRATETPVLSDKNVADDNAREFVDSISATAPACDHYRPVIQPNDAMIEPIFTSPETIGTAERIADHVDGMNEAERLLVLHFCERLVQARKVAA